MGFRVFCRGVAAPASAVEGSADVTPIAGVWNAGGNGMAAEFEGLSAMRAPPEAVLLA